MSTVGGDPDSTIDRIAHAARVTELVVNAKRAQPVTPPRSDDDRLRAKGA